MKVSKFVITLICLGLFLIVAGTLVACNTQISPPDNGGGGEQPPTERDYWIVTFDTNGGTPIESVHVSKDLVGEDSRIREPENPSKEGFVFDEWRDEDANNGDGLDWFFNNGISTTNVTRDVTLTAQWDKIIANISFESNGVGEIKEQVRTTNKYGETPKYGELPKPTREGYRFWGWSFVQPGLVTNTPDLFVRESTEIGGNEEEIMHITLYAWWCSDTDEVGRADFSLINDKVYYMKIYRGTFSVDIDIPTTYKDKPVLMGFQGGPLVPSTADVRSFNVSSDNPFYFTNGIDGVLYNKDMTAIVAYPRFRYAERYEMPSTIKELAPWSFYSAVLYADATLKRTELIFNEGLENIGVGAFYNASDSIRQIQLPSSVKYIGDEAFGYTSGRLNAINIPKGVEYVGRNAFVGNTDLTIYVDGPQPLQDIHGNWLVDGWHKEWAKGIYRNSTIIWGSDG
ncbi:MAG: InlB B-repeat-containing protein [Clostridiales bacterium]|nr:InlB B-repeat-containing protein [Clostridiales bacterium]